MNGKNDSLPCGWCEAKVSDVASVVMGQSPPSSAYNSTGEGLPFFQGKGNFGEVYPTVSTWCDATTKVAHKDDVLLSVRAPVGSTNLAPAVCCIGRGIAAIRPAQDVSSKYLLYALRRFADKLDALGTGTTFKAVSGRIVRDFCLPIAPSAEQLRIVDCLEGLLTTLSAGITALKRCQDQLLLYRASVLKAAVAGDLTADWRSKHPNVKPANTLLQRILAERRKHWEQEQLRTYAEKGQLPPKNWQAKYREPVAPELADLPHVPRGWCWATVDQCASDIQYGSSAKTGDDATGIPVLRMGNLSANGDILLDPLKYLPKDHPTLTGLYLKVGDLLFNRTNSIDLVGKTATYRGEPSPATFASYLIRIRLLTGINPVLLMYVLNSHWGRQWIRGVASQTVGQANVNGTKLSAFAFPLPPEPEQIRLVGIVDEHIHAIDSLDAHIVTNMVSSEELRQAILHHAFSGKLVPQDPNDEPASQLIERISEKRNP